MNCVVNIIGYEYTGTSQELPGIILDLYQVYHYFKNKGCRVNILTDLQKDVWKKEFVKAVADCRVGADITTFIQDIQEERSYLMFRNMKQVKDWLVEHPCQVMFYTGHGIKDRLMLPNNEFFPLEEMRDIVCAGNPNPTKLTFLLDCCHPNGMGLPYCIFPFDKDYKDNSTRPWECPHNVQCFVSSAINEKSVTSKCGSVYTQSLFDNITKNKIYYIPDLITKCQKDIDKLKTGFEQKVACYVNNPNVYTIHIK